MTNEGTEAETYQGQAEDEGDVAAYIAYIGRSSFRMEQAHPPGNDNHTHPEIESERREETLRMRASPETLQAAREAMERVTELEPEPEADLELLIPRRRPLSALASMLLTRLELPRWILAVMTLLVFVSGVLVAASVVGGTRSTMAQPPIAFAAPAPVAPPAPMSPLVTPVPVPVHVAVPAEPAPATTKASKVPARSKTPARRSRTATPPPPSSPGPTAITSGWVDPFAE